MNAEILAVGTELLIGQITNTNARYISRRLQEAGVNVYFHSVVGDNSARLIGAFEIARNRSDSVILTGGLGPTEDDLTKQTIAEALGLKMILHQESLDNIRKFFSSIGRVMTPNNERQAYFPEGSVILGNSNGTAPGCLIEKDGKSFFLLPGPPHEMEKMFDEHVLPYYMAKNEFYIESKFIKIIGVGESAVEDRILDLIDTQKNPTIATYAKDGEVTIRLTARYDRGGDRTDVITPVLDEIASRFGNSIYCYEDIGIEESVAQDLIRRNISVAVAESCTGGLISSALTELPGASGIFKYGVVAYGNEAKEKLLGVTKSTLTVYGAVSAECSIEMANGIKTLSCADICIGVTGIAGPAGGTEEKPVGTVFVTVLTKTGSETKEFHFHGSRQRVRNLTVKQVFNMIRMQAGEE